MVKVTYDRKTNLYSISVPVEDLNTIRAALKDKADFLRFTEFHNQNADNLSVQIEEEIRNLEPR